MRKDIYEYPAEATDRTEDVANILKSLVLEHT